MTASGRRLPRAWPAIPAWPAPTSAREHQLTPELALDASQASLLRPRGRGEAEAPGEVSMRRLEPAARARDGLDAPPRPGRAGGAFPRAVGAAPPVIIVSIGPASLEVGERLSDIVAPAVTRAADLVATIVEAHRRA